MGQLAIAVRITFDRWRHMFEAEVVMEATVNMVVLYSLALVCIIFRKMYCWFCCFTQADVTVVCFTLNDMFFRIILEKRRNFFINIMCVIDFSS